MSLSLEELAAELLRRRKIRAALRRWCVHALAPLGQAPAQHHDFLIKELEAVARGETQRLMINMPPGSAKSTYGSMLFPPWMLAQREGLDIIGASNTASLAEGFSRRTMGFIRDNSAELGYSLTRENAEDWETNNGGRYRAIGVGGAIAGRRADIAIIDDPTRSRADAESEKIRESQWAWFISDLRTRLKPNAAIIVIMTRWHVDDLGGRILERQKGLWKVISLPAFAGQDDPLGRLPGESLWNDPKYPYGEELNKIYKEYNEAGAMRDWAALYQQQPTLAEGNIFKVGKIDVLDAIPAGCSMVRAWDLAATAAKPGNNPDWTVGFLLGRSRDGRYVIADCVRLRGGPDEVEATIRATASRDGRQTPISIPQDPGQAGVAQVKYLTGKLSGYTVHSSRETGDKGTRAMPFASQVNVGNVSIIRGEWNRPVFDEFSSFPSGIHDDCVDAASRAFEFIGGAGNALTRAKGLL